ncbi:5'-nucleotidase SurE, partial [Frankliniella fusca]
RFHPLPSNTLRNSDTPYCAAESVTGQVIRDEIKTNLSALSLDPDKVNLHYVTDDGADIVSAVSEDSRTYCADHCTNLVVQKALTRQLTKMDLYGERGGYIVDNVRKAENADATEEKMSEGAYQPKRTNPVPLVLAYAQKSARQLLTGQNGSRTTRPDHLVPDPTGPDPFSSRGIF